MAATDAAAHFITTADCRTGILMYDHSPVGGDLDPKLIVPQALLDET